MIKAIFYKSPKNSLLGFKVSGHAGLADVGYDVCCASVSSSVMMVANTITDVFQIKAKVDVLEDEIRLKLNEENEIADKLLIGFMLQMQCISDEFSGLISITILEV